MIHNDLQVISVTEKSHIASFQFVVHSCFAKIFNTRSKDVINDCQVYFHFDAISDIITKRNKNS